MEIVKTVIVWIITNSWNFLCNTYLFYYDDFKISYAAVLVASLLISLFFIVLHGAGYGLYSRGGNSRKKANEEDD